MQALRAGPEEGGRPRGVALPSVARHRLMDDSHAVPLGETEGRAQTASLRTVDRGEIHAGANEDAGGGLEPAFDQSAPDRPAFASDRKPFRPRDGSQESGLSFAETGIDETDN